MVDATNVVVCALLVANTAAKQEPSPLSQPAWAASERVGRSVQVKGILSQSRGLSYLSSVASYLRATLGGAEHACR